jgi:hypothetical protein
MKINKFFAEEKFIIENYSSYGFKYCIENLKIDKKLAKSIISKYGLKRNKINKINIDTNNKYFCYLLGLIWSDGHIEKKTNRIALSLVEDDIYDIKDIIDKVGVWNYRYCDNKKRNYRNQISIRMSDLKFKKFLADNDFLEKSFRSPDKVISLMPKDNLKYFIRGISDGDGCFYYNKKQYTRQFCISSTYYQNWNYMVDIFNNIGCKFKIERIEKENSKFSLIRVTSKDILKVGNYIYDDDFFGLSRKYQKFKLIEESYDIKTHKAKNGARKPIIIEGIKYISLKDASKSLSINISTLAKRIKNGTYNYEWC